MSGTMTIYEIATLSGCSISTVSRVLNGNPNVSEATRKRVEETVAKYGFIPKQTARNFRKQDVTAVGLMMNDIRNPYMCSLAYTINRELSGSYVNTILCNIVDVEKEFIGQLDNLIEKKVNGVILMGSIFQHHICRVALERKYSGYPFVSINGNFGLPNVHEITQDQVSGTADAVRYLYGLGKRHIGYIYRHQSASDQRKFTGFRLGMESCGLKAEFAHEVANKSLEDGRQATEMLLKMYPRTDAILYSADVMAVGGVHYMNDCGIRIPDDIAVIGFNNSTSAEECYPPLTSIDNNGEICGQLAVRMMLRLINQQPVDDERVSCRLEIRETTEKKMVLEGGKVDGKA